MPVINSKDNHLTISDINTKIQNAISASLGSNKFWIQGEITGLNIVGGHCYLTLIEKIGNSASPKASIKGMIWSDNYFFVNKKFSDVTGFDLKNNIKILFLGTVNFNISHGLSLFIEDIEPGFTVGSLILEREAIVKRLKDEGHYLLNKKTKFPVVPQRIAVISAKGSQGLEDFLSKIKKNIYGYRFSVTLFSSLLQGDKAAESMKSQIVNIYHRVHDFDIVVIVRGGGGSVNLTSFNDYLLSKAVARFPIPVITGIGHTANISIVDEVAYLDKITPTDVADFIIEHTHNFEKGIKSKFEKIISKYKEVKTSSFHSLDSKVNTLFFISHKLKITKTNTLANSYSRVNQYAFSLLREKNQNIVQSGKSIQRISNFQVRKNKKDLKNSFSNLVLHNRNFIKNEKLSLTGISEKITILDPRNILKRGYSITTLNGKAVTKNKSVKVNDVVKTILFEGEIESKIIK